MTIQDLYRESIIFIKNDKHDSSWPAQESPLLIPASNLNLLSDMRSTWKSMDVFVRKVGLSLEKNYLFPLTSSTVRDRKEIPRP